MATPVRHIPVLQRQCVELLCAAPALAGNSVIIDATLGLGGHSEALLQANRAVRVIGIDRDVQALAAARSRLAPFGSRFHAVHATYDEIDQVTQEPIAGILMDLGVSSLQLDAIERGFSYARPAPLDMRMDPTEGMSAAELVNTASEGELTRIIRRYGEERFARNIAAAIVRARQRAPLDNTAELADLIRQAIPAPARRRGGNPAKRTFQALRIAVNDELTILETTLPRALDALSVGGRMVVMSYHSLEDRLTKQAFSAGIEIAGPPDMPVVHPSAQPYLRALTRKAVKADALEVAANPRAASVRLRAVEKIRSIPPARRSS
ncbi:MAG: 16S rRNA (cytosine(1402)-N(4))-methyltransferase RsmH [Bowdeniella nasicola]|nr:16S rRNA (cytosine(1402)-N(4))-methyltransferase RsmH [Bowdeniella nasicola]